jgi:hypothetical protein
MIMEDILKKSYLLINSRSKDEKNNVEVLKRYLQRYFKIIIAEESLNVRIEEWKKEMNLKNL